MLGRRWKGLAQRRNHLGRWVYLHRTVQRQPSHPVCVRGGVRVGGQHTPERLDRRLVLEPEPEREEPDVIC